MNAHTHFQLHTPAKDLAGLIHSYWTGDFNRNIQGKMDQSVLPNGCIEVIIHLTEAHCLLPDQYNSLMPSADYLVMGMFDKPYQVHFEEHVNVFGLRFFPDGFRKIFGISPVTIKASYADGTDVLGKSFRDLCGRIRDALDDRERVTLSDTWLLKNLARQNQLRDYTHEAMRLIRAANASWNYAEIVRQIPISQRQLQRDFKQIYGMSIRKYLRLMRLNAIHTYMLNQPAVRLTKLSYELDFVDQSHFIREFKSFTGITPKKVLDNTDQFIINPAGGL